MKVLVTNVTNAMMFVGGKCLSPGENMVCEESDVPISLKESFIKLDLTEGFTKKALNDVEIFELSPESARDPYLMYRCIIDAGVVDPEISFDVIRTVFEYVRTEMPLVTRIMLQKSAITLNLQLGKDGGWNAGCLSETSGDFNLINHARILNSKDNPLFIDGFGYPVDPVKCGNSYNKKRQVYMRCVDGASATIEFVVPFKVGFVEIITELRQAGYLQSPLQVTVNYADNSPLVEHLTPYNNNYFLSQNLDQTKRVSSIFLTYLSVDKLGFPSAYGLHNGYVIPNTSVNYANAIPIQAVNYVRILENPFIPERFYSAEGFETLLNAEFSASSSVATTLPASNLLDANNATYMQTQVAATSVTLAFNQNANAVPRKIKFVVLRIRVPAGQESAALSMSQIVITTAKSAGSGNATSNTRSFAGLTNADIKTDSGGSYIDLRLNAGFPSAHPDSIDKIEVKITRTVSSIFYIDSVNIYGDLM